MGDVSIQRGVVAVPNTGTTAAPGTNFADLDNVFVLLSNNQSMSGGHDDGTDTTIDIDDLSGSVTATSTSELTFSRDGGSLAANMRFAWESWEYTGVGADDNEFIVRGRHQITITAGNRTGTATITNTPDNIDNCIPFITGVLNSAPNDDADDGTGLAWLSSTATLNVERGGATDTTIFEVTVVEFTGSNWQVAHGREPNFTADTGSITLVDDADGTSAGGGDITDWDNAVIWHQFKADDDTTNHAIADVSVKITPNATTTIVDWAFHTEHDATDNQIMVHVLKHSDMVVSRYTNTASLATNDVDISGSSLSDIAKTACYVSQNVSGVGAAYSRGWTNIRLTTTANAELYSARTGNTRSTELQIIDLTGVAPPTINLAMAPYISA